MGGRLEARLAVVAGGPPGVGDADRSGLRGEQSVDRLDPGRVLRREARGVERRLLVRVGGEVEQAAVVVALEAFVECVARRRSGVPARLVMDEQRVAVGRGAAAGQHRQQALAVEFESRRQAGAGGFDEGWKHVADVDQGLVHLPARDRPRPPGEVGHVAAGLERPPLAAADFAAVADRRDAGRRAVVADEQDQRVPLQPVLDELRPYPAHQMVHVGHHSGEPLLVRRRVAGPRRGAVEGVARSRGAAARRPVAQPGRDDERVVRQRHRVVDEERFARRRIRRRVLIDRLEHEVVRQVRPEDVVAPCLLAVVRHQGRPPVARAATLAAQLPQPVFVEPRLLRRRPLVDHVEVVRQLPLAGDHRPVARLRQYMGERDVGRVEVHELPVVPVVVQPRHQLDPGRRAQRLRVPVLEPHPLGGDAVELRSLVGRAAVCAECLDAEIVGEDDDDVGLGGRLGGGGAGRREQGKTDQQDDGKAGTGVHGRQVSSRPRPVPGCRAILIPCSASRDADEPDHQSGA